MLLCRRTAFLPRPDSCCSAPASAQSTFLGEKTGGAPPGRQRLAAESAPAAQLVHPAHLAFPPPCRRTEVGTTPLASDPMIGSPPAGPPPSRAALLSGFSSGKALRPPLACVSVRLPAPAPRRPLLTGRPQLRTWQGHRAHRPVEPSSPRRTPCPARPARLGPPRTLLSFWMIL